MIADDVTVIGMLPLAAANSLPGAAFVKSTIRKTWGKWYKLLLEADLFFTVF
jgi:hypothetical protein